MRPTRLKKSQKMVWTLPRTGNLKPSRASQSYELTSVRPIVFGEETFHSERVNPGLTAMNLNRFLGLHAGHKSLLVDVLRSSHL